MIMQYCFSLFFNFSSGLTVAVQHGVCFHPKFNEIPVRFLVETDALTGISQFESVCDPLKVSGVVSVIFKAAVNIKIGIA